MARYHIRLPAQYVPWIPWKDLEREYSEQPWQHADPEKKQFMRGIWIMSNTELISDEGSEVDVVAFPWVIRDVKKRYPFLDIAIIGEEELPDLDYNYYPKESKSKKD